METAAVKIILAIDGSEHSLEARDLVAGLRWPTGSVVHLVGAYQTPIDWNGAFGGSMDWAGAVDEGLREELLGQLATAAEPLLAAGLSVERTARRGRAADVIVDAATQIGADLVVTGSRGMGRLRSMVLGSVAADVAANAPCPVLVARGPTVTSLLVGTDGSAAATEIVERLGRWGTFAGLPAAVVAVAIPDSPAFELAVSLYTLGDERLERERAALGEQAETDARDMAAALEGIGITSTAVPRRGDPAAEIVATAKERGSDLIVVGSRGLSGLDRLLLGSVARNVLNGAECSVLIVRKES
jgi:nucleotide-binding universal stress UspA family protein